MAHHIRDEIVDFIKKWRTKTMLSKSFFIFNLNIARNKYHNWENRYGKENSHNGLIPRDHWLESDEKKAIIDYHHHRPLEGYRRLTYMMLDNDIAHVSPSTTYKVLKSANLLGKRSRKTTTKGKGFTQPLNAHQHWHVDISYININGTFYYLCSVLDGYSRYIVNWDIREKMEERDVEVIIQKAKEKTPNATPRIISDNGPQFIAKDFKVFIRINGMTHVRTSPYYPQSNGKIERWHQSLKKESIRPKCPLSKPDAIDIVGEYVDHYNYDRLHSAIGYVSPKLKLDGKEVEVFNERDRKLETARKRRAEKRRQVAITALN